MGIEFQSYKMKRVPGMDGTLNCTLTNTLDGEIHTRL